VKKLFLAASLLALGASSAIAADLPVKAAPMPVPVFSWTGGYIGVNAGWVEGRTDVWTAVPGAPNNINAAASTLAQLAGSGNTSGNSWIAGGQIGYNWQGPVGLVLGLEADIQGMDLNQNRSQLFTVGANSAQDFDQVRHTWLATFRGRVGFAAWQRTLFYATGGLAVGDTRFSRAQTWSFADGCPIDPRSGLQLCHAGTASTTSVGATAGLGVEWAFAGNWSAKLEYLHVWLFDQPSFRTLNVGPGFVATPQTLFHANGDSNLDIVRVGINYRWGDVGKYPVVAKY
jgi:outer membrane immunogenic protein